MKAKLLYRTKSEYDENTFAEIKVWEVPIETDKPHGLKYSLVYIENGIRVIGYDNAERKGDHVHYFDKEMSYEFKSMGELFDDFYNDIRRYRHES